MEIDNQLLSDLEESCFYSGKYSQVTDFLVRKGKALSMLKICYKAPVKRKAPVEYELMEKDLNGVTEFNPFPQLTKKVRKFKVSMPSVFKSNEDMVDEANLPKDVDKW